MTLNEQIELSEIRLQKWKEDMKLRSKREGKLYYVCRCGRMFIKEHGKTMKTMFGKDIDHECEFIPLPSRQDAINISAFIFDAVRAYELATKKVYHPKLYNNKATTKKNSD